MHDKSLVYKDGLQNRGVRMLRRWIPSLGLLWALSLLWMGCGGATDPCAAVTCPTGQTCKAGTCAEECTDTQIQCGTTCHNTQTDNNHCGGCNTKCREGESCKAGTCELTCSEGKRGCSGSCVDTQTNVAHCGACGNACNTGEQCKEGKCEVFCSAGTSLCGGKCVATSTSTAHCGACDNACKAAEVCADGKCVSPCGTGQTDCSGTCADLQNDTKNCGACGTACKTGEICKEGKCGLNCPQGQTDCAGKCFDIQSSLAHCGACGNACKAGQACTQGSCEVSCQQGQTDCSGECVDLQASTAHCGKCGTSCQAGQSCIAGACALLCKDQETNCSGSCVNLNTDPKNCSACGQACQTDGCCGGACTDLQTNDDHCGSCGTKCSGGKSCSAGKCVCPSGQTDCNGACVDLQTNDDNCGACNNACKTAEACLSGKCNPAWAIGAGGISTNSSEFVRDMAQDSQGNLYILGSFGRTITIGSLTLTATQGSGVFVAKLSNQLQPIWAKAYESNDIGFQAVKTDASGNVYITGRFTGKSLTLGSTTLTTTPTSNGSYKVQLFVGKLNTSGAWQWATAQGGVDNDEYGENLAIDNAGNVYVAGHFESDGASTFGNTTLTSKGNNDIMVVKFNSSGIFQWVNNAGSSGYDRAYDIAIDSGGNLLVTGHFSNNISFGSTNLSSKGGYDAFIAKLNANGSWLWANGAGGNSTDYGYRIAMDKSDNAYVVGYVRNIVTLGTFSLVTKGGYDIFVAKADKNGQWLWGQIAGSGGSDYGQAIALDSSGNVYVTGHFFSLSASSHATFGSLSVKGKASNLNMFVAKLNSSGTWQWVKAGLSSAASYAYAISVDGSGNVYASGYASGNLTFGSLSATNQGASDIFVTKLNSSGTFTGLQSYAGTSASHDYSFGIAQDTSGNTYITGYFSGEFVLGTNTLTSNGNATDLFVAKVSPTGQWLWARSAGGTSSDFGYGIAVDNSGSVYITGQIYDKATFGNKTLTSQGNSDIFVAKLNSSGTWQWVTGGGSNAAEYGWGLKTDSNGNVYVVGNSYTGKFGTLSFTSQGNRDIFVGKLNSSGVWQWVAGGGGNSSDFGYGIDVDSNNNVYVVGTSETGKFGTLPFTSKGDRDAFVGKLNGSGVWQWVTNAGGNSYDHAYSIARDSNGNLYTTGGFETTATFGSTTLTSRGSQDIFIAKLDNNGTWLWVKQAGGKEYESGLGLDVSSQGTVFVTGLFLQESVFGTTSFSTATDTRNIFVSALDSTGQWLWTKTSTSQSLGSSHESRGIVAGQNGEAYVTGHFSNSANFGKNTLTSTGNNDIFVWLVVP
ncbi:MAG: hypothetical protein EP343_08080 [Deltaproteobacteria bacterium]|nr:MAG: hypothetical protein EP343_08080 [Deltaproteobacteria bacterium]